MAKQLPATAGLGQEPARALDRREFARQFEQSYPVLWTLAAGVLGDRIQAEDVVQEAAVIALAKLERFQPGTSFVAWMGQVVRYVALNQARKRSPARSVDPEVLDERSSDPGAAGSAQDGAALLALETDQADFDDAVVAALRTLSPVARACLLLRSVQGLDYRELSAVLGIPEGTAMSHVHRSRASLRQLLSDRAPPLERIAGRHGERPGEHEGRRAEERA